MRTNNDSTAADGMSSDAGLAQLIVAGKTRSLINKLMLGDVAHHVAKIAAARVLLAR